mmetsp:Transcript_36380/g.32650  ORF Transcript_36380/g.32650 Transcript_36380/m.32650 type:complete len:115 (+) Transcript_36380:29-373(+)|eukprot:CAMPEP_0114578558 /NCGR_PEP_ID=MMETSP0125-20121206/3077_1 /TAXON_ID=485358 ORGANISM="Aristerostoma sp., Strain ATCC 50986" /NCGR_SAMPLE_ID=MMETSP0125 /ASSEMBLY_ACC=CAM_ASM_000245 /LENGTH=114 /DNA_ID=CAMNT_0001768707 /DNA_START=29 /DNA_END=373 /DNA_ORIENTATION=+
MKTIGSVIFVLLALQASASWVILETYTDGGCVGDAQNVIAFEDSECYSTGTSAAKYDDGNYYSYDDAADCGGPASIIAEVGDTCEDIEGGSVIVVASGLNTPVNSDYPLTTGKF